VGNAGRRGGSEEKGFEKEAIGRKRSGTTYFQGWEGDAFIGEHRWKSYEPRFGGEGIRGARTNGSERGTK